MWDLIHDINGRVKVCFSVGLFVLWRRFKFFTLLHNKEQLIAVLFLFPIKAEVCRLSPVAMGLLHTSGGRGALTSSLRGQLFTRGFASSGLTGSLLSTGHDY